MATYAIVQRNSTCAWEQRTPLRGLLEADPEVTSRLSAEQIAAIFDVESYLEHIDESFRRIGLDT